MLRSGTFWRCGVTNRADCGQCHAQMDGQREAWRPVAASAPWTLYYGHSALQAGRSEPAAVVLHSLGGREMMGVKKEKPRGGLIVRGPNACCQTGREHDFWIGALLWSRRLHGSLRWRRGAGRRLSLGSTRFSPSPQRIWAFKSRIWWTWKSKLWT